MPRAQGSRVLSPCLQKGVTEQRARRGCHERVRFEVSTASSSRAVLAVPSCFVLTARKCDSSLEVTRTAIVCRPRPNHNASASRNGGRKVAPGLHDLAMIWREQLAHCIQGQTGANLCSATCRTLRQLRAERAVGSRYVQHRIASNGDYNVIFCLPTKRYREVQVPRSSMGRSHCCNYHHAAVAEHPVAEMPALEARKRLLAVEVALQHPQLATPPRVAPLSLLAAPRMRGARHQLKAEVRALVAHPPLAAAVSQVAHWPLWTRNRLRQVVRGGLRPPAATLYSSAAACGTCLESELMGHIRGAFTGSTIADTTN